MKKPLIAIVATLAWSLPHPRFGRMQRIRGWTREGDISELCDVLEARAQVLETDRAFAAGLSPRAACGAFRACGLSHDTCHVTALRHCHVTTKPAIARQVGVPRFTAPRWRGTRSQLATPRDPNISRMPARRNRDPRDPRPPRSGT
jgi:hypothetical protein